MGPPYQMYHNGFRTYRDWIDAIPGNLEHVPLYITETNQNGPWLDQANGWIPAAYQEIDRWNASGGQVIRALILYRWPRYDDYYIDGKANVIRDFQAAQAFGYQWPGQPPPPVKRTLAVQAVLTGADGAHLGTFQGTLEEVL